MLDWLVKTPWRLYATFECHWWHKLVGLMLRSSGKHRIVHSIWEKWLKCVGQTLQKCSTGAEMSTIGTSPDWIQSLYFFMSRFWWTPLKLSHGGVTCNILFIKIVNFRESDVAKWKIKFKITFCTINWRHKVIDHSCIIFVFIFPRSTARIWNDVY